MSQTVSQNRAFLCQLWSLLKRVGLEWPGVERRTLVDGLMDWFLIDALAGQEPTILSSITMIDQRKFISETGASNVPRECGFKSVLA